MDKKEIWLDLLSNALAVYEPPKNIDGDELIDDMIEFSTELADGLLDAYEDRFDSGSKGNARRRKKQERRRREEEEEEDEDLEGED